MTTTLTWHWPLTGIVTPDRTMPVGLVSVSVPPLQTLVIELTRVRPLFNVSLNPTPVRATVLADGLAIVNVSVLV